MSSGAKPIIYGRRAAALILQHQKHRLEKLMLQEALKFDSNLTELFKSVPKHKLVLVEKAELDLLTKGGVHQGLLLELKQQTEMSLEKLIEKSLLETSSKIILALDEVCDPHNLGAIFRAADAFGVDGIISTDRRSAALTEVARKASAGASEFLPFCTVSNLHRALLSLKKAGFWIVGTDLSEEAQDLAELDLSPPIVVVMGSEGRGIRDLTKKSCDFLLKIPLSGVVESLNVSQATAVVLWELRKRV